LQRCRTSTAAHACLQHCKESPQILGNDRCDFSGLSVGFFMSRLQRRTSSAVVRITLSAACATIALVAGVQQAAIAEPSYGHDSIRSHGARDTFGPEQRASELYVDGLEKLEAGHRDFARSTFESVLAKYPDTPAAERARRVLDGPALNGNQPERPQHHADAAQTLPAAAAAPETTGSLASPEPLPAAPAAIDVGFRRGPTWDLEVRRNASIQAKLRVEAGDRVFFSPGSAELGSRARVALAAQAQWLMRWHEFEAAIEGHADEPGSEQENVTLSVQRAEAVRRRLIAEGVDPGRLAIVPMGRSVRFATCADVDCRAQNRRAVTLVFATGTHERLGLVTGAPRAADPEPKVSASFPDGASAKPALARPVGVAR